MEDAWNESHTEATPTVKACIVFSRSADLTRADLTVRVHHSGGADMFENVLQQPEVWVYGSTLLQQICMLEYS